ncbi:hypothetical protein ACF6JE_000792 [Pseudomonas aeruginosa]
MKFEYDEAELFAAVNEAVRAFFLDELPAKTPAPEIRARASAYSDAVGRIVQGLHSADGRVEHIRLELQAEIQRYVDEELRPGGKFWKAMQGG